MVRFVYQTRHFQINTRYPGALRNFRLVKLYQSVAVSVTSLVISEIKADWLLTTIARPTIPKSPAKVMRGNVNSASMIPAFDCRRLPMSPSWLLPLKLEKF